MSDSNGIVTESASYDSFGRTISSNLTTRYQYTGREYDEYDGLSRLTRLKHAKDTTTLFDYQYTHNTAQQITAITEPTDKCDKHFAESKRELFI